MYGTEQGHNKHNLIEGVAVEWGTKTLSIPSYCRQSGSMQYH